MNKPADYSPTNKDIFEIRGCQVLRLVGPGGQNPNIDEPLQELSGLKELQYLEILVLTHHEVKKLDELADHYELRTLFIHNNEITNLNPLLNLLKLEELYCHSNNIESLKPLSKLINLKSLVCNNNKLNDFEGITEQHTSLKTIFALPCDGIGPKQIRGLEDLNIFCK